MNRNRLITLAILGAIVVVAVLGWVVGISPVLGEMAAADQERTSIGSINDVNAAKLVALKKQFENIGDTHTKLDTLRESIPADADMAAFLRTIKTYGDAKGVQLTSVEVSGVSAFVAPAETSAPATTASASPTPSPSASTSGTTAPTAAPASGLIVIPISISITGTYDQVMAFAGAMQSGPRLFLVSALAVSGVGGVFTGDLSGKVYALPASPSAAVK